MSRFSEKVEFILQTTLDPEHLAALTLMEPPTRTFQRAVHFPNSEAVVGVFANQKVALIQTDVADAVHAALCAFPSAKFLLSVGICYAFDRKVKISDVVVSKKIIKPKIQFKGNGKIIDRGETIEVVSALRNIFCKNHEWTDFKVSNTDRQCKVYSDKFLSHPLMDSKNIRDMFKAAVPGVIGGEKEGGTLLRFQQARRIEGAILIKGVVDYGEGGRFTAEKWYFTASLAALSYAKSKLLTYKSKLGESKLNYTSK